jgi:hypothetical protein
MASAPEIVLGGQISVFLYGVVRGKVLAILTIEYVDQ